MEKLAADQSGILEPKDLLEIETRLHQEVAQSCLDPVVGALIQDAHDDEAIQVKAAVLQLNRPYLRLQKSDQPESATTGTRSPQEEERPQEGK